MLGMACNGLGRRDEAIDSSPFRDGLRTRKLITKTGIGGFRSLLLVAADAIPVAANEVT